MKLIINTPSRGHGTLMEDLLGEPQRVPALHLFDVRHKLAPPHIIRIYLVFQGDTIV